MSIYNSWNYREFLAKECQSRKQKLPGFTLQKLAHRAGVQPPYLTNVFKERAHLSQDQADAIAAELGFAEDETAYLQLLLEWERSARAARKAKLRVRLETLRREKLNSKAHLKKQIIGEGDQNEARFFLNPYYKVINACLGIPRFAEDPARLAVALGLTRRQIMTWVDDLVAMGFARRTAKGFEKVKRNFHLPQESPLCAPHQNLLAQASARQMQALPDSEKYNFAVTFSADAETRENIQREFLKFLKAIEGMVKDAPAKDVYGLSFDLFRWSRDGEPTGMTGPGVPPGA